MIKTPPTVMPDFIRINDGDLSEIELHSVDSINDLHVEHFSKGVRLISDFGVSVKSINIHMTPAHHTTYQTEEYTVMSRSNRLHQGHSTNGNLQERPVVYHTDHAAKSCWRKRIFRYFSATYSRYSCGCMAIALLLVTIGMIFCFLVQQGSVLQALFQGMRERQEITLKISRLIEELHSNLTSSSG